MFSSIEAIDKCRYRVTIHEGGHERSTIIKPGTEYIIVPQNTNATKNRNRRCVFVAGVSTEWGMYAKVKYLDTGRTGRTEMQHLVSPSEIEIIERSREILERKKNMMSRKDFESQMVQRSPMMSKLNAMSPEERAAYKPTADELKVMENELKEAMALSKKYLGQRGHSQEKIAEMWEGIIKSSISR